MEDMRRRIKQILLDEFRRRGARPPEDSFVDFMVSVIADDAQCTWSAKTLLKCIEVAVDAYIDEMAEREVARRQLQRLLQD